MESKTKKCTFGEWRDDKREGNGVMVSESGDIYDGYWKYDIFDPYNRSGLVEISQVL